MSQEHKFFELIRPDHNWDFVGKTKPLLTTSVILIILSFLMLPINTMIKGRGHALNFAVDFRGGTEMEVAFTRDVKPPQIRAAMEAGGFKDVEIVQVKGKEHDYLVLFPAVSVLTTEQTQRVEAGLRDKLGA